MPQPLWRHACAGTTTVLIETPECLLCDGAGEFDRWYLTGAEHRSRYEYIFGLQSIGEHRPLADTLLRAMRRPCAKCDGYAVLTSEDGETWWQCPWCEGTGGFWAFPAVDVDAVRRAILQRFPAAEANDGARFALATYGAFDAE